MKKTLGDLSVTGVPQLLHLIYKRGDGSATLNIVHEPVKKRFYFKNGQPVSATSNILNEVLGRLLMQEGIITRKDYETSLEIVLKEKMKHGEVLISMGLITPVQLNTFLTLQLKRRVWNIFSLNTGSYHYTKTDALSAGPSQIPLHPASLILEGISLGFYPEQRLHEDLAQHLNTNFKASTDLGLYSLEAFHLNLQEKRFLESFDGSKELKKIIEGSDLLRRRTLSLALTFIITGLIKGPVEIKEPEIVLEEKKEPQVAETGGDSRLNAELLFIKAKGSLEAGDFKNAIDTLKRIIEINPTEGEYWAYLGWAAFKENPGNIREAKKIIKDAIDLNTELDRAWYFLGALFLADGDESLAEKAFRTSVEKNPWMLDAISELKRIEIKRSQSGPLIPSRDQRAVYMDFFGFERDPFANAPDFELLKDLSGPQADCMEALLREVRKKSGPVLLEGIAGTGKTTLGLELLRRLSGEKVLAAFILNPPEKDLQLIKDLNSEVNIITGSHSIKDQLLSLGMRVSQNKIQGGHTLTIIDKAHLLTPNCLKLIQYLARLKTLQIVLLAEPSLLAELKNPEFSELDQKLAARIELRPFTMEETGAFISKRLDNVKKDLEKISLTEDALKTVFEETGGVPGEVINKMALLLSKAAILKTRVLDKDVATTFRREAPVEPAPGAALEHLELAEIIDTSEFFKDRQGSGAIEGPGEDMPQYEAPAHNVLSLEEVHGQTVTASSTPELEDIPPEVPLAASKITPPATVKASEPVIKVVPGPAAPAAQKTASADKKDAVTAKKQVPAAFETPSFEKRAKEKKRSSALILILWIFAMLLAGLITGSLIGILYFVNKGSFFNVKGTSINRTVPIRPGVQEKDGLKVPAAAPAGQAAPQTPAQMAPATTPATDGANKDGAIKAIEKTQEIKDPQSPENSGALKPSNQATQPGEVRTETRRP